MEVILVLLVGGIIFAWRLSSPPEQPAPKIEDMTPGEWASPGWFFKVAATFFVVFAATSWMGGIGLLIAATAILIIFWYS